MSFVSNTRQGFWVMIFFLSDRPASADGTRSPHSSYHVESMTMSVPGRRYLHVVKRTTRYRTGEDRCVRLDTRVTHSSLYSGPSPSRSVFRFHCTATGFQSGVSRRTAAPAGRRAPHRAQCPRPSSSTRQCRHPRSSSYRNVEFLKTTIVIRI